MNKLISNKIKYLYLLFTLGMVMYHARFYDNFKINYLNDFDYRLLNCFYWFAEHFGFVVMSFFFFMSAFWFYKDLNDYKKLFVKLKKKIHTLLIPFLVWSLILGVYKYHFGHMDDILIRWFYYLFESPVAGPLWYILGLLILQLFSPIILLLKKNSKIFILFSFIICSYLILRNIGVIPKLLSFNDWWWYENLITYSLIYYFGILMATYGSKLIINIEYNERKYTFIGIGLIIISWNVCYIFNNNTSIFNILICLLEIVGIWFILKPKLFKKGIPNFGDCSFYVFALHNSVLIPIFNLIFKSLLSNYNFCGIAIIGLKILEIFLIYVIAAICKYMATLIFSDKVNYYLTGGR